MKKIIAIVCAVVIALATVLLVRSGGCEATAPEQTPELIANPLVLTCAQWQALGFCPKPADERPCQEIIDAGECPLWILAENFPTNCAEWQALGFCPVIWTCAPWLAIGKCPRDIEGIRCSQLIEEDRCPIRWNCAQLIARGLCPMFPTEE